MNHPIPSTGGEGKCRTCNHPKSDHHSLEGECMKLCSNQETSDEWYCDCPRWEPPAPISEGTPAAGPWCYDMDRAPTTENKIILVRRCFSGEIKVMNAREAAGCSLNAWSPIFAPKEGKP